MAIRWIHWQLGTDQGREGVQKVKEGDVANEGPMT